MIDNDDLLYRVDRHYLGPTGFTLPIRLSYSALGLGFAVLTTVFVIGRAVVHVPLTFASLAIMVALAFVITAKVTRYVNADRPLRSVFTAAWNDLHAPRPPRRGQTVVLRIPAAVRAPRSAQGVIPNEGKSSR